jgi:hypothetical protein
MVLAEERVGSAGHTLVLPPSELTSFAELAADAHHRTYIDVDRNHHARAGTAEAWTQIRTITRAGRTRRQSDGRSDPDLRTCGTR